MREHAKFAQVITEFEMMDTFLLWLTSKKGVELPNGESNHSLLAEYLGINPDRLNQERLAFESQQRKAQQ